MPTQIAVAVVEHQNQFLIGQRPPRAALAGLWEFPGGKVEIGETAEEAAVRECLEETGVLVSILGKYSKHEHSYDHDTVVLNFFRCQPATTAIDARPPFQWVRRDQLSRYDFPEGNAQLLKTLVE